MPYDVTRDLTAGPLLLPGVAGSVGAVYSKHRTDKPGWGAAVELPAVLEILAAITVGQITAAQAQTAFAPFLARLEEFDREMDRRQAHFDYS
ncbi:hypothetical protein [Streptomyces vietnamensis]|uniref:Uncharacterized protein n=1 Tax=Streptomyces vietnamensis TaxID=362257 RepID=A0A0B5ILB4_9ACTN|nr:hypothetical protein [Streptomyces vietnamensis]AJF70423.1 hypothetical protein SVTN_40285 [Streptomyces vietnamensis]